MGCQVLEEVAHGSDGVTILDELKNLVDTVPRDVV